MNNSSAKSARIAISDQRYLECGQGTLAHPVTGKSITTEVIELEGFGRIFEVMDYSGSEVTMYLIRRGPEVFKALKAATELLGEFTRNGRPFVPQNDDPVWAKIAKQFPAMEAIVVGVEARDGR